MVSRWFSAKCEFECKSNYHESLTGYSIRQVSLLRREEMGEKVKEYFEKTGGSLSQKIAEDNSISLQKAGWDKLRKLLAK